MVLRRTRSWPSTRWSRRASMTAGTVDGSGSKCSSTGVPMTMTTVSASATFSRQVVAARERWRVRASGSAATFSSNGSPPSRSGRPPPRSGRRATSRPRSAKARPRGQAHPSAPAHDDHVGREPPLGAVRPEPDGPLVENPVRLRRRCIDELGSHRDAAPPVVARCPAARTGRGRVVCLVCPNLAKSRVESPVRPAPSAPAQPRPWSSPRLGPPTWRRPAIRARESHALPASRSEKLAGDDGGPPCADW